MKNFALLPVVVGAIAISALFVHSTFAAQGSGQSASNRNDNFVVICHYDRNDQGPNAGPHTITINANALDQHLLNHVKAEGFVGDDHVGVCTEPTAQPTIAPTATAQATVEPTAVPTLPPD